ncbi:diacylglycerol kinase family protein [uncultured Duncaniella sp.]|uniref:diacylglycerol/lipid kinase family protein n=1 Tax=uncultured Duncaniella sp. TaxID=2768039 RepID=UPI0025942D61|nr:diacylglycerol kinase family protein [uncultured Duncaniella sp.]
MPKARLIINPISGTRNKAGLDRMVLDVLSQLGWEVEVTYTKGHGDATRLALSAIEKGCDTVIAAGGDGTINETAAALCGTGVILGILPCGSGNGLARHLGIPVDLKEGLKVIIENHAMEIDYATVNDCKFFCTCGVGFDAAVSAAFAKKKTRGKLTYIQSTFQTYASYEPEHYTIMANGKTLTEKAFLVAVCNASQYGNNAYIAPSASINDGLLDVTIIHAGNTLSTALVGVDMLTGFIERNMLIHTFRTDNIIIERERKGASHVDGEPMEMDRRLSIRCHHNGLKVFTPTVVHPFRPILTPVSAMFNDFRIAVNNLFQK